MRPNFTKKTQYYRNVAATRISDPALKTSRIQNAQGKKFFS